MSDPNAIRRVDLVAGPPGPASTVPGPAPVTTLTANFVQPDGGATVTIAVASSAFWSSNQAVFVALGGDYIVTAVPDSAHLTLLNLDTPGSAAPGSLIPSGSAVTCNGYPGAGTELAGQTDGTTTTADLSLDLSWVASLTTFRLDTVVVAGSHADDATFTLSGLFRKDINGVISPDASAVTPGFATSGALAWTASYVVSGQNVNTRVVGGSVVISWATLTQIVRVKRAS